MSELSVQLTANIKELEKQLDKADKRLVETGEVAEKSGKKVSSLGSKGMNDLKKSTANTTPTLLEFNRTIQDAPFGIQGVANNIQQLTANFSDLSRKSGGTIGALKALAGGLIGPQGVLLGVSLVTSLLVTYGDELFKTTGFTKKLAEETGKFVASAQSEINTLRTLLGISRDETQSKKVRSGAIEEINQKYSKYLGNLDLDNVKTKEVTASVEALTKSLLKQAQVKGLESSIASIYEDSGAELTELLLNQRAAAKSVKSELDKLRGIAAFSGVDGDLPLTKQIKQVEAIVKRNQGAGQGLITSLGFSVSNFNQAVKATKDFKSDLESQLLPLQELLNEFTVERLFTELAELEGVTVTLPKIKKDKTDPFYTDEELAKFFALDEKSIQRISKQAGKLSKKVNEELQDSAVPVKAYTSRIEDVLTDFNANMNDIVYNGIANTLADLGRTIGEGIISGANVFENTGKVLLSAFGAILGQLGELLIQTGIGILAAKTALKSLNPYVAIAGGIALVAIAGLFSSSTKSLSGNFGGGASTVSGQGSGGSITSSPVNSSVFNTGESVVVFEISGQNLVGVLNRTLGRNKRLGGNNIIG